MPAWSPDGRTLAYSGEADGYCQIFTRQLNQSTPSQLTRFDVDCVFPQWDSGGTRVFFLRASADRIGETSVHDVFVVSAAGGAPERVIEGALAFAVVPDHVGLVYLRPPPPGDAGAPERWGHDLKTGKGRKLIQISSGGWRKQVSPGGLHLSPDGRVLAVAAVDSESEVLLLSNPLAAEAGASRRVRFAPLEGGTLYLQEVSWLPDSRRFVASLRDPLGGDLSLWLADTDRGTVTRITASVQWESTPAMSPDGSRIAFSATPLNWDLLEVDLRNGRSRPLVASSRYDGWGEWMPDGSGILYSTTRTGRFEIWEESLRDQATRAIVTPAAFPDAPSYFIVQSAVSPDGCSVAYVRYSPGMQRVYVSAVAGSRPVQLTDGANARSEEGPVWSAGRPVDPPR